jgi:hypothetical protein
MSYLAPPLLVLATVLAQEFTADIVLHGLQHS